MRSKEPTAWPAGGRRARPASRGSRSRLCSRLYYYYYYYYYYHYYYHYITTSITIINTMYTSICYYY